MRPISIGYFGLCRHCGAGLTKPWGKRWRSSTAAEMGEAQAEAERIAQAEPVPGDAIPRRQERSPGPAIAEPVRRKVRVSREAPAQPEVEGRLFPKSHRRKLEEADIHRRAIDLAFYLIRDHGAEAEAKLAERASQPNLTDADRRRLRLAAAELAYRRRRDAKAGRAQERAG